MSNQIILSLEEHEYKTYAAASTDDISILETLGNVLNVNDYKPSSPDCLLGIDWGSRDQKSVKANYYVGYKWIVEGKSAVHVRPKINNLDLVRMFMDCFNSMDAILHKEFSKIYCIDYDQELIHVDSEEIELTPMLIVHFLSITKKIVQKGLKCNYKQVEENLKSKVKGKILFSQHIKRNILTGRCDRTMCRYQEYSVDCIENRILKKTLFFVKSYLNNHLSISCRDELNNMLSYCLGAMSEVEDCISLQALKHFKVNPLFKEYGSALKVAKLILRRFSYDIQLTNGAVDNKIPPFSINMPILFELYIYSLLKKKYGNEIGYHIRSNGNEIDFVKYDEQLIIDTKYITKWDTVVKHDNIRQLSGYARNVKLREKVIKSNTDYKDKIIDCLIIYPNEQSLENQNDFTNCETLLDKSLIVKTYVHFYKFPIFLPIKD